MAAPLLEIDEMSEQQPTPEELWGAMGMVIRREREKRDLTQEELSAISGVERRTLSNVEKGESDKLKHFVRLSWSMGIEFSSIVARAEAMVLVESDLDQWSAPLTAHIEARSK